MTILVFGKDGQLSNELARIKGRVADLAHLGIDDVDLTKPADAAAAIRARAPDAVINAAAYTAVDRAEEEEAMALLINGDAPTAMARACAELGIPFVNVSTDYVFEGGGEARWKPDDPTGPINAYGRTKLAGEQGVQAAGGCFVNLRTSWVFSAHGVNFVKSMLKLSETRDSLNIVADQIGGPTPARELAAACLTIAEQLIADSAKSGNYHFSGAPDVSWHGFAAEIFRQSGRATEVNPIPTTDYPTPAARPLNSRLDCQSTQDVFGVSQPDWRQSLADILTELKEQS